jgi:hypothetical protein
VVPIEQYCLFFGETLPLRRTNPESRENRPLDESNEEMKMKKASLLVVLVILFLLLVVGRSNHTQQVMPRTAAPANVGVLSFFPTAPASQTGSEAPRQQAGAPVREFTERSKPDPLPGIAAALDRDKKEFCRYSQSANCDEDFLLAFDYRMVTLSKGGQVGFIVEFSGAGFCGSAGCAINVLKQSGDKFESTLENDEVGSLDSFELATTITNGFYDLKKHGSDGTDYYYSWTGSGYEDVEPPLSAGQARTVAGASEPAQRECKDCVTAIPVGVRPSPGSASIR